MSTIEYISTPWQGKCLIFNNNYFRIDKIIKNKKYWKNVEHCGAHLIIPIFKCGEMIQRWNETEAKRELAEFST